MANIPIRDIPGAVVASPDPSNLIPMDNGSLMQKTTIANAVNTTLPLSSQAEAEAGVDNAKRMSSLRTKQAIDAQVPGIVNSAITALNLGTMSQEEASDYTPTAGLAAVALSNSYTDLSDLPTLGTAAATDASDYATAAQGAAADTAVQPSDLATVATSGDYDDLSNKPTLGTAAALDVGSTSGDVAAGNRGLPTGGTTAQALVKASDSNYDVEWVTSAAATAVSYAAQSLSAPQQLQARENIGADDAANLTTGTLPNDRVSATLTPDKAFRRGNVLGTVSQSSGVPTGALTERGSNANGEYARYFDGTQICWQTEGLIGTNANTAVGPLYESPLLTWNFPSAFDPDYPIVVQGASNLRRWIVFTAPTSTGVSFNQFQATSSAGSVGSRVIAIGRWF